MTSNFHSALVSQTMLFPCTTGVQIPHIGAHNVKTKVILRSKQITSLIPMTIIPPDGSSVSNKYLQMVSERMSFSQDVVEDRCLHMMPFNEKYFSDVFEPNGLVQPSGRMSNLKGRPKRSTKLRWMPCYHKKMAKLQLLPGLRKPVKEKPLVQHQQEVQASQGAEMDTGQYLLLGKGNLKDVKNNQPLQNQPRGSVMSEFTSHLSETAAGNQKVHTDIQPVPKKDWDDRLISKLSQLTANWIVHERTPADKQKEKLSGVLESWYGQPTHTDLIREEISDGEEDKERDVKQEKKRTKEIFRTPLSADYLDPYSQVYSGTIPITDCMDPYSQGDKTPFDGQPVGRMRKEGSVYHNDEDPTEIHLNSHKYKKQQQSQRPEKSETWYTWQEDMTGQQGSLPSYRSEKEGKPWRDAPVSIHPTVSPPALDSVFIKHGDPRESRKVTQNQTLVPAVNDWFHKWFLSGHLTARYPGDLLRNMADIQPHVRLKAIGAVAKHGDQLDHTVHELPEDIFLTLESLLEDSHEQIRRAAAMTLYSVGRPTDKAQARLYQMLDSKSCVNRWAAVQCLVHYGNWDSHVVAEILKQILSAETTLKYQQGIHLLAQISNSSNLVHCMVAEHLNSGNWRHRVIACEILATLFGSINKDITHKLCGLMWHDWHLEVRHAAAQCLGKTGHGKEVHDNIRDRILNGPERNRLEAIIKVGQLGIMTAKLLPAFLQSFADPYVSIRCQVCIISGHLKIKEKQVLDRLLHLATFDPIWKVKALAIQALGKIGEVSEVIKNCLVWAMRYQEKPGVRAEACHSLLALNMQDDDVLRAVEERLLVESSQIVREELIAMRRMFTVDTSADMDMVAQMKVEVQKLNTGKNIAAQILVNEVVGSQQTQLKGMVCQAETDIQAGLEWHSHFGSGTKSSENQSTSTPLPKVNSVSGSTSQDAMSYEGSVFTPTADNELQYIFNSESASRSQSAKSQPVTEISEDFVG